MMIPNALLFSRYRAFRDSVRLDLSALTVVIGKNGGGKSLITRLPLLLSGGLSSNADAPIDLLAGNVPHAARYEDLIFQRSAFPFSLGAEITDGERTLTFQTTLRHVVERHILVVEAFELLENNEKVISLSVPDEEIGKTDAQFQIRVGPDGAQRRARAEIIGLFPVSVTGDKPVSKRLSAARGLFEKAFASPSYLGPFRSEEGSLPRIPRQGIGALGTRGEHALDLLGDDALRGDGQLVDAVENWFEQAMNGNRVSMMDGAADLTRILVHDPIRNVDIDLAETGAGFAQVFPIVVQALSRQFDRISSSLLIVEQPELHLHPAAHGGIADLIVDTVNSTKKKAKYICETHSEQIITRLRRRVAEGKLSPDDISIISIAHQSDVDDEIEPLRKIQIDSSGNLTTWPVGVFSESFDDLVLLREAARGQRDSTEESQ